MDVLCRTIQAAILGGKVKPLEQLLLKGCGGSDAENRCHSLLAEAYAELTHRNIPLSDEMVHFIEYELVRAGYQNAAGAYRDSDHGSGTKSSDLRERVVHMVECIDAVVAHNTKDTYTDIDEMLILRLRQIYAHVFFLKTHLRKLPLLQLQFCIAVFLKLVTGQPVNGFDIYAFTIDKERLIRFLRLIRNQMIHDPKPSTSLEGYYRCIQNLINRAPGNGTDRVPKRVRSYMQMDLEKLKNTLPFDVPFEEIPPPLQQALKSHYDKTIEWDQRRRSKRVFKELYDTYFIMKQHYSIRKVLTYIDGIREGPCNDPPHKHPPVPSPTRIRAIKRTLQVIGEMVKSTRESPNITAKLNRILQLITSEALTERTKDLRQFFSHGYSLAKWELEEENGEQLGTVFQKIETNLREARRWFVYTQTQQNILIYRRYLAYLKKFQSIGALRSYIAFVGTEFKASLIEKFLPEQLTEAKLLIQYMLDHSSLESLGAGVRDDLRYVVRELQLRIDAIRSENGSLGRTVDEFFFLETYIRLPTATITHVRRIVDWIILRTALPNRHKLVQKTDLMYARDLLVRLQMSEMDEERRYLWGKIWELLAKERFGGLDTLLGRTEQRIDAALDATVRTMQALNLPLDENEYVQFVNRRLAKSYYPNVYVLDNKYRVLKEIAKDRRARTNVRDVLERLKELRRVDETMLQEMFDGLLDGMEDILSRSDEATGQLSSVTDQLALEYCLLEVSEILCNLALFRENAADLATPVPVVTGRNLRNYLAHDVLAYDTLTSCTGAVVLNARYLVEHRMKLYSSSSSKAVPANTAQLSRRDEKQGFKEIFDRQTRWTMEQVELFDHVAHFRVPHLERHILAAERAGSDVNLLLQRRTFLNRDLISIALAQDPATFVDQLLAYEANGSNFFHLLLTYSKDEGLIEKIKVLIKDPHSFCCRLAIKYGLMDVFRSVRDSCAGDVMRKIISTEMSSIFIHYPPGLIRELVDLLPPEWLHGLKDHLGNTVLHWTILHGDTELLLFVLERVRILLKAKNEFGDLPLLIAVRYHTDALVDILLEHGADPWIEPKVVHMIALRGSITLLDRLRDDRAPIVTRQYKSDTHNPLRAAIEEDHFDLFVMLHRSFKYKLDSGELLHLAARLNRVVFLRYLLTVEKDTLTSRMLINAVSKDYCFTPLMLACATGHYEAARVLLDHGAEGKFRNENDYTPWHCAVYGRNRKIVSLLLAIPGVDVNLSTRDKRSAMSIAIESDHTVAQILSLLSADVVVKEDHVLLACILGKMDSLKLLIDRHPEFLSARDFLHRSPLMIAVGLKDEVMTRYLLDRGADCNDANILGMNLLHVTALNNMVPICKMLLQEHVNCEATDNFRRTPLVVALENEHLSIAELLLEAGASVESAYRYRFELHRNATLLHKFTVEKRPRMVEYLAKKLHFPTDILDDDGKTADMYAT